MARTLRGVWLTIPFVVSSACVESAGAAESSEQSVEAVRAVDEGGGPALPGEVLAALRTGVAPEGADLDRVYTLEHDVPVGPGRRIHLTESFTLRSWQRWPHRAMLMLPGPIVSGEFYNIDVDGYRGRDLMAQRGFFAFTADFEGTGRSTFPADGRTPTMDSQVEAFRHVIRYVRLARLVPRVDVLGESWGGGVAAELCSDRGRVRSCVLASMLYRTPSDFANMTFRSPAFRAFLDTLPDGYLPTWPDLYAGLVANSPAAVQAWVFANVPGRYTTVPLYDVFDLPFFDPSLSRAPGLVVQGENDPNQSLDDARELVRDYGGGARLVVIPGAGHIPRIEAPPHNVQYWEAITDFVDP